MNVGNFPGASSGVSAGSISRYIQTPVIFSSRTIAVPPGTQRIEALLVGGGGGGGNNASLQWGGGGGGGFGGAAVIEIPITGTGLVVIIGAGGVTDTKGGSTSITSAGTIYALVGGGSAGAHANANGPSGVSGASAGGGGGGGGGNQGFGGPGGGPPIGKLLWSIYPQTGNPHAYSASTGNYYNANSLQGAGGWAGTVAQGVSSTYYEGKIGCLGAGGGGGGGSSVAQTNYNWFGGLGAPGGGGGGVYQSSGWGRAGDGYYGGGGGGGGYGGSGGSLTSVSIWGFTGYSGGILTTSGGGGGGGGLFGAGVGTNNVLIGGVGGLGGGGGGGGINNTATLNNGGVGGNGAAVIRFYL